MTRRAISSSPSMASNYGATIGYDAAVARTCVSAPKPRSPTVRPAGTTTTMCPTVFNLGHVQAGRDIYVGGRVGYVTSPKTDALCEGRLHQHALRPSKALTAPSALTQHLDTDGYRLGAGVEYALTPNAYIGAEYRYSNYSQGELRLRRQHSGSSSFNIDTDRHQVVADRGLPLLSQSLKQREGGGIAGPAPFLVDLQPSARAVRTADRWLHPSRLPRPPADSCPNSACPRYRSHRSSSPVRFALRRGSRHWRAHPGTMRRAAPAQREIAAAHFQGDGCGRDCIWRARRKWTCPRIDSPWPCARPLRTVGFRSTCLLGAGMAIA